MSVSDPDILDQARRAIASIASPDGAILGQSPCITGLSVNGGRISVSLQIAPGEHEAFMPVRDAIEAKLRQLEGVTSVFVVLTADSPAPAQKSTSMPPKLTAAPAKTKPLASVRHVVAVASGKGGVGKSTTTVNLALAFRALGWRVGVLDADIYGPSIPTLLGLTGKPTKGQGRSLLPMQAYGLKAMSMGVLVDPETAMVWRGPMIMSAITQLISDVAWGELDLLLVDMPPGTGDAQLALAQGTDLSGAIIVLDPAGLGVGGCATRHCDVQQGQCDDLGHYRKHVAIHLPGLRQQPCYFRARRRAGRGDAPWRAIPWRAALVYGIAQRFRCWPPYLGARPGWPAGPVVSINGAYPSWARWNTKPVLK